MILGLAGDAAAHSRLLGELARLLRRYYRSRMSGQTADLEDLIQETLIAVHTRRESYDPARPFTAWAFALARYKMIDAFRRRGDRLTVAIEEAQDLFADDAYEGIDAAADLETLMADLSPNQRQSIQAVKVDGLSVVDAATRTGLSPSNVKISVHRGLKAMIGRARRGKPDAD